MKTRNRGTHVVNQRPLDVTMTKTVTGDTTPEPGGTTQYTMVVTNHSQYWATYLALVDELPAHLVPTSTPTAGCMIDAQTLRCKLPALAPGASTTVVVNAAEGEPGLFVDEGPTLDAHGVQTFDGRHRCGEDGVSVGVGGLSLDCGKSQG